MELTAAHLRYLLAIYEVSQTHLDICSRSIAEKLNVTKPSVVRIMNLLMDRGMIVKEHYGKIYLTDRGIFVAKAVRAQLETVLTHFPPVRRFAGGLRGHAKWRGYSGSRWDGRDCGSHGRGACIGGPRAARRRVQCGARAGGDWQAGHPVGD